MNYLLDTHTYLWFIGGDAKLPKEVKTIIEDLNNVCFISIVSFWEITIKAQLGKLELGISLNELMLFASQNEIEILPIEMDHLLHLSLLPSIHSDPFDRLIISQAQSENLIILGVDKSIKKYKVKSHW